jgi:hypothetical protein
MQKLRKDLGSSYLRLQEIFLFKKMNAFAKVGNATVFALQCCLLRLFSTSSPNERKNPRGAGVFLLF